MVIYSRQHLLQQTQEVKAASKSVSTADRPDKNGLEEILSIRFQEFLFRRASAPDFQNLIGTSHKLEDQQCGKKETYCLFKRLFPQTPLYDLNTCCYLSAWLHVPSFLESPLGFSQLLFAQIYGSCKQGSHIYLTATESHCSAFICDHLNQSPGAYSSIPKICVLKLFFFLLPECKWKTLKQYRENQYF